MKNGEYSADTDKKIIVNFRMTPEEKKKLLAKAEEAHMSLSGYIISLSRSKRVVLKDEIGKLTVEISRIGNNINQIARVGNSQKYVYKAQLKYISDQLSQVEELLKKILKRNVLVSHNYWIVELPCRTYSTHFNFFLLDPVYHAISTTTAQ